MKTLVTPKFFQIALFGPFEYPSTLCNRVYEVLAIARRYHARDRETLASILKFPMKQVPILNLHDIVLVVSRIMPIFKLSCMHDKNYYGARRVVRVLVDSRVS